MQTDATSQTMTNSNIQTRCQFAVLTKCISKYLPKMDRGYHGYVVVMATEFK